MRIQYFVGPVTQRHTGGEIYHAELMRFLARENEVTNENGVVEAGRGSVFSANRWCWQRMCQYRAEVIIEDCYYAACLCLSNWLAKIWRPRIIAFVQEVPETCVRWPRIQRAKQWVINALFLRSASLVVANSDYIRRQLLKRHPLPADRVRVLPPAGQSFPGKLVQEKCSNVARLLSVANIQPKKGQRVLVEALHLLDWRDWNLTLVGGMKDPAYYQELLALIAQYGFQQHIRVTGFLEGDHLAAQYQTADIFVHAALEEPYGMVVAEAMQWGLPIIASRTGGIPEVIGGERNALLVPPGDPGALAEALHRLIADPQLRTEMGQRAKRRAVELPTWDEVCERFYRMLLALA